MPKVNWCKSPPERRRYNALHFMSAIEAARAQAGLTAAELCQKTGMSTATYARRKRDPLSLTVEEIQTLSSALSLKDYPPAQNALLALLTS